MRTARALLLAAALATICLSAGHTSLAGYTYKIYCVGGIVRVEHASLEELKGKADGPVCELARTGFTSLTTARKAARRFGGIGAPCRCVSAKARAAS